MQTAGARAGAGAGAGTSLPQMLSVTVQNVGSVAAAEVVLLFVHFADISSAARQSLPNRQLIQFGRTPVLGAGQAHTLHLPVDLDALVNATGARAVYAGQYEVVFSTGEPEAHVVIRLDVHQTTVLSTVPIPTLAAVPILNNTPTPTPEFADNPSEPLLLLLIVIGCGVSARGVFR